MHAELHNLHWLWKETVNRLDSLARDVREAKNVAEASNFAHWLQFSGLLMLFRNNPSTTKHLEVDESMVRKKIDDLIYECGELFRGGKHDPKYAASDIAEINRKLDLLIAGGASKTNEPAVAIGLHEANAVTNPSTQKAQLAVIPGGLDEQTPVRVNEK